MVPKSDQISRRAANFVPNVYLGSAKGIGEVATGSRSKKFVQHRDSDNSARIMLFTISLCSARCQSSVNRINFKWILSRWQGSSEARGTYGRDSW